MPVYGRNKGREDDDVSYLPRGAESWRKWVDRRAAVSCRELLGNGRNGEVRGAAVSCHMVPKKVQKWGKARREGRGN